MRRDKKNKKVQASEKIRKNESSLLVASSFDKVIDSFWRVFTYNVN